MYSQRTLESSSKWRYQSFYRCIIVWTLLKQLTCQGEATAAKVSLDFRRVNLDRLRLFYNIFLENFILLYSSCQGRATASKVCLDFRPANQDKLNYHFDKTKLDLVDMDFQSDANPILTKNCNFEHSLEMNIFQTFFVLIQNSDKTIIVPRNIFFLVF